MTRMKSINSSLSFNKSLHLNSRLLLNTCAHNANAPLRHSTERDKYGDGASTNDDRMLCSARDAPRRRVAVGDRVLVGRGNEGCDSVEVPLGRGGGGA